MLDPPIVLRLASFEVISVTQPRTRRLLISLAGESPWDFDYSAGQDLLLLVANDGARCRLRPLSHQEIQSAHKAPQH